MVYKDHGSRFVFSIVGGEIDSISLFPTKALWDSLPGFQTTGEAERVFGKPASHESLVGREEMAYRHSGLDLVFDSGVLTSMKWYYPDYHDMVLIPAGFFLLGTSRSDVKSMRAHRPEWGKIDFSNEMPQQKVRLDSFYIDRYEVTNRQFQQFQKARDYNVEGKWRFEPGKENCPATWVTWSDARAYAEWAGKRLPTEIEWEKAARCTLGYWYPWGAHDSDASVLANYNFGESDSPGGTAFPVDSLDNGQSLYGVYNMAGNVMEWCANPYDPAYYRTMPKNNPKGTDNAKSDSLISVRGGSYLSHLFWIRAACRYKMQRIGMYRGDLGFRCVKDIK